MRSEDARRAHRVRQIMVISGLFILAGCDGGNGPAIPGPETPPSPLPAPGSIAGSVSLDGSPVPAVVVRIEGQSAVTTDPSGVYRFEGMTPGAYIVQVDGSPDGTFLPDQRQVVVLAGREAWADFHGVLHRTSAIHGRVRAGGQALAGVQVLLPGETRAATTGEDGEFRFDEIPRGAHEVRIGGFDPARFLFPDPVRTIVVSTGQTAQADFEGSVILMPPPHPERVTVRAASETSMRVSWTPAPRAREYLVERRRGDGLIEEAARVPAPDTALVDAGLEEFTGYEYRLAACNEDGCSAPSGFQEGRTLLSPPSSPTFLVASLEGPGLVRVSWVHDGHRVEGFQLRRLAAGNWTLINSTQKGATSVTDSDLSPGESYTYQVRACGPDACSAWHGSAEVTIPGDTPPAPVGLAATATTGPRVDITWTLSPDDPTPTLVRLERRVGTGAWQAPLALAPTPSAFTDEDVAAGTRYSYRLRSCNESGCSAPTSPANVEIESPSPGTPVSLAAIALDHQSIAITWDLVDGRAATVELARASAMSPESWAVVLVVASEVQGAHDHGLTPSQSFRYRIRACNASGCSTWTPTVSVSTPPEPQEPPPAPVSLGSEASGPNAVDLSWSFQGPASAALELQRATGSGSWSMAATLAGTVIFHRDDGLQPSTEYRYRIRACLAVVCSAWSDVTTVQTVAAPESAPTAPNQLQPSLGEGLPLRVVLAWVDRSNNETHFEISRSLDQPDAAWSTVGYAVPNATAFQDLDLVEGASYRYRVRACADSLCSDWSGAASIGVPAAVPAVPLGLLVVARGGSSLEVSWEAVAKAERYQVSRKQGTGSWVLLTTLDHPAVVMVDSSLVSGTTYTYRVRACRGADSCSAYSGEVASEAPTPAASLNLWIETLHVNQTIQTLDGEVPLVAGRPGTLRVFVLSNESNNVNPVVRVRIFHGSSLVATQDVTAAGPGVRQTVDETLFGRSWNLNIPGHLIVPGLRIQAEVDPDGIIPESITGDNLYPQGGGTHALDVREVPPLRVRYVPVQLPDGSVGVVPGDMSEAAFKMQPLSSIVEETRATFVWNSNVNGSNFQTLVNLLSAIRAIQLAESGQGYIYYGVYRRNYSGGFVGAGYIGAPASIGVDDGATAVKTFVHELGHNFGRYHVAASGCGSPDQVDQNYPHPNGTIGAIGVWDNTLHFGSGPFAKRDYMGYCGLSMSWTSDYTFKAVLNWLTSGAAAHLEAAAPVPEPVVVLWGNTSPDYTLLGRPIPAEAVATLPSSEGPLRLEGRGADGQILFQYRFTGEITGEEDGSRHFSHAIPLSSFDHIALAELRLYDNEVLRGEINLTPEPPAMAMGEQASIRSLPDGARILEWNAANHPFVVIRDPDTGSILSFVEGSSFRIPEGLSRIEASFPRGAVDERRIFQVR